MALVTDYGEIGVVGSLHRTTAGLWTFTVYRDGVAWNLAVYETTPTVTLKVAPLLSRIDLVLTGTLAITTAASGIVSYTLGASDPIDDASGVYEGRVYVLEAGVLRGVSDRFRYSIGDAPGP